MHDETAIRLYDRRIENGKITVKRVYNLAHCNICGITVNSANIYKVILNDGMGKVFSIHSIELCKPCMHKLGKKLLSDSKE